MCTHLPFFLWNWATFCKVEILYKYLHCCPVISITNLFPSQWDITWLSKGTIPFHPTIQKKNKMCKNHVIKDRTKDRINICWVRLISCTLSGPSMCYFIWSRLTLETLSPLHLYYGNDNISSVSGSCDGTFWQCLPCGLCVIGRRRMCLLFWLGYVLTDHSWLVQCKVRIRRSPEPLCCWVLIRWGPCGWHMEAWGQTNSALRLVGYI
jgi:hypothetical protein